MKLDCEFEPVWARVYGDLLSDERGRGIIEMPGGGYVVVGHKRFDRDGNQDQDMWVLKLDPEGNVVWQKAYGGPHDDSGSSLTLARYEGQWGVMIAGDYGESHTDSDIWVVRLNAEGEVGSQYTYGSENVDLARFIRLTRDGGYVGGGVWNLTDTVSFAGGLPVLFKLDRDGDVPGCSYQSEPVYSATSTTSPLQAISVITSTPHVALAPTTELTQTISMTPTAVCENQFCITVTKSGPSSFLAGSLITYTLAITNSGPMTATDLIITDPIPTGADYVSGGTKVGDVVSWTVPALAVGEGRQVAVVVTATESIINIDYHVSADGDHIATGSAVVTVIRDCGARVNDAPTEYPTVQAAVDVASAGDTVKVAGYCAGVNTHGGLTQTVYISKSITLRGGYTATNWTTPDPYANPTTLDTQGQGRVLYITGDISPTIEGVRITGGDAAGLGGGPWGDDVGGGLYLGNSAATLSSNIVSSNTAYHGGGMFLYHSAATLSGNIVSSNTAAGDGGGLHLYRSDAILINNVIADNHANTAGSGLYIVRSSPHLLHNTIARNSGGDGSGVYVTSSESEYSTVALTNTILVCHTVAITVGAGNAATLEGTLWGIGNCANGIDWGGAGTVTTGTVNLWGDPGFVDPAGGDYHIGAGSAAVDAGVNAGVAEDIDGEPRPAGANYDIGTDEFQAALSVIKQANTDLVRAGAQLTYTIRVTNTGNVDLHAIITDTLPEYVTTTQPLVWPSQVIPAPDGVWIKTVVVTVGMGHEGDLINVVEVTTEEGVTGNDSVTVSATYYKIYLPLVLRSS